MDIRGAVESICLAVDTAGVGVIVVAIASAGVRFARGLAREEPFDDSYRQLRQSIGRGILLGLELLVAGDIIRTVAIAPTFSSANLSELFPQSRTDGRLALATETRYGR